MAKIWFAVLLFCVSLTLTAKPKMVLSAKHLTGAFYVYTTWKPIDGKPYPSNGMYIVTSQGIVIIDSPWDTTTVSGFITGLERQHHKKVIAAIATHFHEDRTGAFDIFRRKGIKTYSSQQTLELCKIKHDPQAEFTFQTDTIFDFGDQTMRTYYPGPGHSPDNIVLWFEKERILYGGCFIKSCQAHDLGNLSDADPQAWMTSVNNVKREFPNPRFTIPGHQDWKCKRSLDHTAKLLRQFKK